jgi:hypothetical protein
MEANATIKAYGTRVQVIGRDDDYGVYEVLHSDGQVGWGSQDSIVRDSDVMAEARGWVADCQWADGDSGEHLSDATIQRGIERHYDGGWIAFVRSCGTTVRSNAEILGEQLSR